MEHEPPPPYCQQINAASPTIQQQTLEPWQRRWNREWYKDGFIKNFRRLISTHQLPSKDTRRKRNLVVASRAYVVAHINEGIDHGIADEEDAISTSRWRRIINRLFGHMKCEYEEFLEWRRDRKNENKFCKVTAIMEDIGDSPKWKGEMTFKIPKEYWSEFVRENRWFKFPSPENIKWFWVTEPNPRYNEEKLVPPSRRHWGPDPSTKDIRMPFRQTAKGVKRNIRQSTMDSRYWDNFVEGGGEAFFR